MTSHATGPHSLLRSTLVASWAMSGFVALAACSGTAATPQTSNRPTVPSSAPTSSTSPAIPVTVGFYPIAYLVGQVGGDRVTITTLTKPGAEPHDLELTPQDVAGLSSAKLIVTLTGLQPAVDTAVALQAPAAALDLAPSVSLDRAAPEEEGQAPGGKDPHFWLDPIRFAAAGQAVADRLSTLDPANAAAFHDRATAFTRSMGELDTAYRTGLASCSITTIVTGHAAFGYLAARYGLTQVPIAGLSPDEEPSAKKLADVAATVTSTHATTVYAETLVDSKFAQTVATSTGARVAVLDPIEGITSSSAGSDYLAVMKSNLATLRAGQGCQ